MTPDLSPTIFCILEAVFHSGKTASLATKRQELKIRLQLQEQDSATFRPLVAKIVKWLEPFTSSVVLLIQQVSNNKQFILKLNDGRLGHRHRLNMEDGELPWTPALEEHLPAAVRNIQLGTITNWFELVDDWKNPAYPRTRDWEDWMWEIEAWTSRITDYVPGTVIEYIQGVSMGLLKPGVDIPRPEAEALADRVMDAFSTIKAEKCVMHNDIHIDNILLRDSDRSPVHIDFAWSLTRKPGMNDQDKDHGMWRRKETPLVMYYSALSWNEYVENQPEDCRRQTFERVPGTDWEGVREEVLQWRVKPGIQCRDDQAYKIMLADLQAVQRDTRVPILIRCNLRSGCLLGSVVPVSSLCLLFFQWRGKRLRAMSTESRTSLNEIMFPERSDIQHGLQ
ncbi:uncharacterized protein BT62DRAFT_1011606 [Guyanagaster necrorhizus]|uniref:Uncharacterized protein n=1 Tax=Guyanagaster necrorhizus TaxID=856835 RepID=A0A9P7VK15_9AGAR|nr:uncharacterized protein BT62DRAFT_1011606 [Guyanagaster necrorhizus MCA 3950]KAG7441359.1 hypothetical protein BT62DRAFT_1011606 [Guyanagaster necrorhizus MCA 3950]